MTFFRVYVRSLRMLRNEAWLTGILLFAGACTAAVQLYEPILFGHVIDSLSKRQNSIPFLWLWGTMGLINVAVSVFLAVMSDRLAHRMRLTVLGRVFERAITLPFSYHAEHGSGRVVRAILAGTDQLFGLWLTFVRENFPAMVGIIALIPAALTTDRRLALLLFGLAAIYLAGNWYILRRTQGGQARVEDYNQDVFGRVGDVLGNVTVVQSYTRLIDEAQELRVMLSRLLHAQYPVLTWWGLLNVITRISSTMTMVAILAAGSWLARTGQISVGEIVAFTGFSGLLIQKLDQVSAFVARTMGQAPALQNFFDLLDKEDGPQENAHAVGLSNVQGEVEFKQVTLRYPKKSQGVFDLNFKVPAGQTVALVGPSGSGKTTTVALLQRLFDVNQGSISIDGHDIRQVTLSSLRQAIAAVFQDAGLFNRSIAENIRVGRPSATDAEVEAAAVSAEAHEFIITKPGGYQHIIGERGASLSGGERQRVAIARAILKNAPILVFDEATSALDNATEKKIQAAIAHLRQGKTTFVIAHRLSTVVNADFILVYNQGRIVQSGRFEDLKEQPGLFNELLAAGELARDQNTHSLSFQ